MTKALTPPSAAIASAPDVGAPPVSALEVWYVATRSGTVAMTLDELDDALERGELDAATQLWIPGMAEWEALGTLATLEDGPPLERSPGAMLEYGLDAERATHDSDGSVLPGAGDIRDYDPFSLPPPSRDTPDPNGALWASILPLEAGGAAGPREERRPWWRAEARAPWMALVLTGTVVLCLSLLGVARLLFAAPASADLGSTTLTLASGPAVEASAAAPMEAMNAYVGASLINPEAVLLDAAPAPSSRMLPSRTPPSRLPPSALGSEPKREAAAARARATPPPRAQGKRTTPSGARPKQRAARPFARP